MDSHTKVFRAHRALAWFYAAIGICFVAIGAVAQESFVSMLPLVLTFGIVFSAHYFTARACRQGKAGGRTASIVIACLMLVGFPVGTLIGIYLLANTWKPWGATASGSA